MYLQHPFIYGGLVKHPKSVNTYGVHRYTLNGGTVTKHKSILYFSNIVTKHLSNNKDVF